LTQAPPQSKYKLAQPESTLAALTIEKSAGKCSKFLAALLFTFSISLVNVILDPVKFVGSDLVPAKISSKGRAERAANYLSNSENPAVVFIGSSLIFRASFQSDKAFEHLVLPTKTEDLFNFKTKHVEAQHFERLLKEKFDKSFSAIELGIPASMISDQRTFVDKLILFKKTPRVLISTIAPREFYDNAYKDAKETTAFEQISTAYPMSMWWQHPEGAWFYLTRHLSPLAFLCRQADALNVRAYTYRFRFADAARTQVLHLFNQSTAPSTLAPEQLFAAPTKGALKSNCKTASSTSPARVFTDLDCYRFCYNPPDYEQFDRNMGELTAMAKACKRARYVLVIVDMPVTNQNRLQMVPEALARYRKKIWEISKNYGAKLIVPEKTTTFQDSDFADSVHVTANGGEKIFQCIVNSLFEDPHLRKTILASD